MPRVSVIIPTYNKGDCVARAIESVLAQVYQDREIIVVDDGSTDNTSTVLSAFDDRIISIYQSNRERSAARNTGIRHAQGAYIAFLDADDVWLPIKLQTQIATLEAHPRAGMVYARAAVMGSDGTLNKRGKVIGEALQNPSQAFGDLVMLNRIPLSTAVVRRECLDAVGWFDEQLTYIEDWDLWLRLAARYEIAFTSQVLGGYRAETGDTLAKMDRYRLQDTVPRMIARAFDHLLPDSPLQALKVAALAQAHLVWGACLEYALGRVGAAQAHLEQAAQTDRRFLSNPDTLAKSVAQFAAWHVSDGREFLARVFAHMPPVFAGQVATLERRTLARYWLELGYQALVAQHGIPALGYAARALWQDPGLTGRTTARLLRHSLSKMLGILRDRKTGYA